MNAVADPTHVRLLDVQTFKYFCRPSVAYERPLWRPLSTGDDGASVFADLQPLANGTETDWERILLFFE